MQDIKFITDTHKFKYRVNGVIIHNNKLLTIKMSNGISYCLPGGHIEFGEDTKTAVIREMLEETKTQVTIDKELAFVESFYTDKNGLITHELSMYYLVNPVNFDNISLDNYTNCENDKGILKNHNFEWLDLSKLNEYDFKPNIIQEKLFDKNFEFEHIILK